MTVTISGSGPVSGVTTLGMTSGTITGLSVGGLPDATITQAEIATGVAGNGPAFSVSMSTNQSVTTAVFTKVAFNTVGFDTNSCYDTTNYRFTPNVAGYYQVNFGINSNTTITQINVGLYKNGSNYKSAFLYFSPGGSNGAYGSALVYLNGSTDYIELYGYLVGTTPAINNMSAYTRFDGALVRAA